MPAWINYVTRNLHYARPGQWRAGAKALYRRFSKSGVFLTEDEMPMCSLLPEKMLREVLTMFEPRSVLDAGCGTGKALDFFVAQGIDAMGVEASRLARSHSRSPDRIVLADLRQPLDLKRAFDLVWCFEVAEHIHPRHTATFIETLTRHAPRIVMSAAPPGQGGEGHFNEQPQEYWIEQMARVGYAFDASSTKRLADTEEFYSQNMMVFKK